MDLAAQRPWWPLGDLDQFGEALQYWLSKRWHPDVTVAQWWDDLASAGLTVPTWQRAHGGLGATTPVQQAVEDGLAAAGTVAPPVDALGIRVVGPALRQYATADQLAATLPGLLNGQHAWGVLLHDVGSDDPAATAVRCKVDWKYISVDGAKVLTGPATCTHAVTLVRSGDDNGRRGLSCLLIDLATPGITRDGDTVHFSDVQFPLDALLGRQNDGWSSVKVMLPYFERSLAGRIRRGVVHCDPGTLAGNLERTVGDVIASYRPPEPPAVDRRQR